MAADQHVHRRQEGSGQGRRGSRERRVDHDRLRPWYTAVTRRGGYIVAPPSQIGGKPYRLIKKPSGHGGIDWAAVTALLEPQRHQQPPALAQDPDRALSQLARWVASQPEGSYGRRNRQAIAAIKRAGFSSVDLDWSPFRPRSGLYVPYIARRAIA
jgi:hypothetical protein